ncbi:MAG: hypothetical protein LBR77_06220 [Lachnospiraceae bacterium]|jgi:ABC-type nitrate/sulfonate/bicarbonate transport system substrate-binding protein|nr:hypothetical protein [Lachnospiraceae bacterium]
MKNYMNEKTKYLSAWAAVALLAVTLAGCGQATKTAETQATAVTQAAAAVTQAAAGVTQGAAQTDTAGQGAAASGETQAAATQAPKELVTVRVPTATAINEYYIGDKLGFFEEEGIKLEQVTIGEGITVQQAAEQGLLDYLTGGHITGFARAQLAGIRAIATHPGMVDSDTLFHIAYYVDVNSPLTSLDDLSKPNPDSGDGKWKFGVNGSDTCITGYPVYYLNSKGLDTQYVQFVQLDESVQLQSLSAGQLDISAVHSQRQPEADLLIADGVLRRVTSSWEIFGDEYAGLSVRGFLEPFIDAHRDDGVVQGFSNAHYKARVWLNDEENRKLALEWAVEDFGIDPTKVAFQRFTEDHDINPGAIDRWFEVAYIAGELSPDDPVKPTDTYTNEFASNVTESKESIVARRPK